MTATLMKPFLVLTGPTGVGKTAFVDALLERGPFEVINLDSCQVYAFFRVGPGRGDGHHQQRRHLYGFLDPQAELDPERFIAAALACAHEVRTWGGIPLFEGGSRRLLPRLARAAPLRIVGLQPPVDRGWIRARLEQRVEAYFVGDAIVREVQAALQLGYGDTVLMRTPMVYQQTVAYLCGRATLAETKRAMVESMLEMHEDQLRRFAELDIHWIDATRGPAALFEVIGPVLEEASA